MKLIISYLKNYKKMFLLNVVSVFGFALVELGIPTIVAGMIVHRAGRRAGPFSRAQGPGVSTASPCGGGGAPVSGVGIAPSFDPREPGVIPPCSYWAWLSP